MNTEIKISEQKTTLKTFPNGELNFKDTTNDEKVFDLTHLMHDPNATLTAMFLLHRQFNHYHKKFIIPYFPYSRSDKNIGSEFGNLPNIFGIMNLIGDKYKIVTEDFHSLTFNNPSKLIKIPSQVSCEMEDYQILIFPDETARKRYCSPERLNLPSFGNYLIKSRILGDIKMNTLILKQDITQYSHVVFIDDICSGGATFFEAFKFLKEKYPHLIGYEVRVTFLEANVMNRQLINDGYCYKIKTRYFLGNPESFGSPKIEKV